jgi:hypothetical protein
MTARQFSPEMTGKATPSRILERSAASARRKLFAAIASARNSARLLAQAWPANPAPERTVSLRVASSKSGTCTPGAVHATAGCRAFPRTTQRCPTSHPSGFPMASSSSAAEPSTDSASASTRATRYCTRRRAALSSRVTLRRAIATVSPPTTATASTPVRCSAEPKASLARPRGSANTRETRATIVVCRTEAPIAAISGPTIRNSTSMARAPNTVSTIATRQTATSARRNVPFERFSNPIWVREPNQLPLYSL